MNKLIERTVADFNDLLASDAPAPGGGSAAALSGAMGCALGEMVVRLTLGKSKFEGARAVLERAQDDLSRCRAALTALVDTDTEAYNQVAAAYRLPKGEPSRADAIQRALIQAAESPLSMLRALSEAALLLTTVSNQYNTNCASDLGTAAALTQAAAHGAHMNVAINASGIADEAEAGRLTASADALRKAVLENTGHLIATVGNQIAPSSV